MNTTSTPNTKRGFTLVELLVVIAIIGILAGIVIPNVSQQIYKGQLTAAVGDIKGIETSVTAMLSDTTRSDLRNWFEPTTTFENVFTTQGKQASDFLLFDGGQYPDWTLTTITTIENDFDAHLDNDDALSDSGGRPLTTAYVVDLQELYTNMMYQLLRQGKNAEIAQFLKPEIRQKLGNGYMEIGLDPWDQQYQFWIGPTRSLPVQMFRSYRIGEGIANVDEDIIAVTDVYAYNDVAAQHANDDVPGSAKADYDKSLAKTSNAAEYAFYGMPASKDLTVYIYSRGYNNLADANAILQVDENFGDYPLYGGGDDINNWDNEAGWTSAPR